MCQSYLENGVISNTQIIFNLSNMIEQEEDLYNIAVCQAALNAVFDYVTKNIQQRFSSLPVIEAVGKEELK
ncbi:hypothetical protein HA44_02735 [Mixta gaviniae]|nr:hypothetical protein HA44_02735 [Mixta gaviniae]